MRSSCSISSRPRMIAPPEWLGMGVETFCHKSLWRWRGKERTIEGIIGTSRQNGILYADTWHTQSEEKSRWQSTIWR